MFVFGTKAQTLEALGAGETTAFRVPPGLHFTVGEWRADRAAQLARIRARFGGGRLAVRSSALAEDGHQMSLAGAHHSVLNVAGDDAAGLEAAIDAVVASFHGDPGDQVLVQPMVTGVEASGVIMTRSLTDGSPYYVLNYDDESGRTDSVTGGTGVSKTVLVHRASTDAHIDSDRVRRMVALARHVEAVVGPTPVDIEFGLDSRGDVWVFQVRPISTAGQWHPDVERRVARRVPHVEQFIVDRSAPREGVWGSRTILGNMPDWNPAEIIGATPRPLAVSLYRHILTRHVWRLARQRMGYRAMPAEELMVVICGRPFIDVRNSFNSFLPEGLEAGAGGRIVDAWLERLDRHPELHDKVEFDVAFTARDFCYESDSRERYGSALSTADVSALGAALSALTRRCLDLSPGGSLARAEAASSADHASASWPEPGAGGPADVADAMHRLDRCRRCGTLPFAVLARHAFIAEALLRSAIRRGALAPDRLAAFKQSIRTVLADFTRDMREVVAGRLPPERFLEQYGHLRPGTYDIASLPYRAREDLFAGAAAPPAEPPPEPFVLTSGERRGLDRLLAEARLEADADLLLEYARRAIAGREAAKFRFSRDLSAAIELIARWGASLDLGRDDLSYLTVEAIGDTLVTPVLEDHAAHFQRVVEQQRDAEQLEHAVKMSYIIRGVRDLYVVPIHRSAPNFVTAKRVDAPLVIVAPSTPTSTPLGGRVVAIENADPGFDWIFAKGLRGLVTKFGGANSHMAVRCAELGLPAAIGCGEQLFESLRGCPTIELNCAEKTVRPVYGD